MTVKINKRGKVINRLPGERPLTEIDEVLALFAIKSVKSELKRAK
jgi:hypothetical protein